jgi:hypothetical protein
MSFYYEKIGVEWVFAPQFWFRTKFLGWILTNQLWWTYWYKKFHTPIIPQHFGGKNSKNSWLLVVSLKKCLLTPCNTQKWCFYGAMGCCECDYTKKFILWFGDLEKTGEYCFFTLTLTDQGASGVQTSKPHDDFYTIRKPIEWGVEWYHSQKNMRVAKFLASSPNF